MKFVAAITIFSLICIGRSVVTEDKVKVVKVFVNEVINMCQAKLETPYEAMGQLLRGEFDKGGADELAMCQISCMMEEFGTLDNGNSEAYEAFISQLDNRESVEILKTCQLKTGKNDCERGYEVYKCLKIYFTPNQRRPPFLIV